MSRLVERDARAALRILEKVATGGAEDVGAVAGCGCVGRMSSREREVLAWVAAGKTDAQIAAILGISVRTVHKHLEHVYVKLGVEGRTAAVMRGGAVTKVA